MIDKYQEIFQIISKMNTAFAIDFYLDLNSRAL